MTLNIILISWCVVLTTSYLIYLRKFPKRNSISAYAEDLTKINQQFLTYVFIWIGICFPLAWVGDHWITTLAALLLALDGLYTGYNPTHLKKNWQNIIHVLGVDGGILLFVIGMFLMNWKLALIITLPLGLTCVLLWIKKAKRHTYWIEIIIIVCVILFLIIEKII